MQCFNHPHNQAIGLCKHCQKGLCEQCAHDLGDGLACQGKHEKQVEILNLLIKRNAKAYQSAPVNILIMPLFYGFIGLIFMWFSYMYRGGVFSFQFILGAGFIVFALLIYLRGRSILNNR